MRSIVVLLLVAGARAALADCVLYENKGKDVKVQLFRESKGTRGLKLGDFEVKALGRHTVNTSIDGKICWEAVASDETWGYSCGWCKNLDEHPIN
jgi:hypothetical protein